MSTKSAIITGSTSGIGLGIAHKLASQGVNLLINGFGKEDEIESIVSHIINKYNVQCLYHSADMSRPEEIEDMTDSALRIFNSVDILVNNAGIQHVAPIDEFPPEKLEAIIRINLLSAFYTIKYTLPSMRAKGSGRVINIASAHGLVASPFKSAYVAAKHGIVGLTKSVALEVAEQGITVNAICPGYVKTPLVLGQVADTARTRVISETSVIKDILLAQHANKKFVEIEQVASLVAFLCSKDADPITGTAIPIDCGWTAH
jgi:3-hydroxybutyrate dehydrogenase